MKTDLIQSTYEFTAEERADLLNKFQLWLSDTNKYPLLPEELEKAKRAVVENGEVIKSLIHLKADSIQSELSDACGSQVLSEDIKIQNELKKPSETMLVDQMAAAHHAALSILSRLYQYTESIEISERYVNMSTKLMRIYQNGMQVLSQIKNAGKQTIVVKHQNVQVNQTNGGQTVIADEINTGGGGHE